MPRPPAFGPSTMTALTPDGAPVTGPGTLMSPSHPAGAFSCFRKVVGSRVLPREPATTKPQSHGRMSTGGSTTHPTSMVWLISPTPFLAVATKVLTPYGAVIVECSPANR